jgi:hypothetical protein
MMPLIEEPGTSSNFYINGEYTSVLHVASAFGAEDVIEVLLLCGADPNVTDRRLRTPLHYAALHRHFDSCRLLVSSGGASTLVKDDLDMYPYDLVRAGRRDEESEKGGGGGGGGGEVSMEKIFELVGGPSMELLGAIKLYLEEDEKPDLIRELIEKRRESGGCEFFIFFYFFYFF